MDYDLDIDYKPCANNNRLKLKKGYIDSADDNVKVSETNLQTSSKYAIAVNHCDMEIGNSNSLKDTDYSTPDNDSLCDFKSPKAGPSSKNTLKHPTVTIMKRTKKQSQNKLNGKCKKKHTDPQKICKDKSTLKSRSNIQPTIESTFFKTSDSDIKEITNIKTAHVCPLCFKPFENIESQTLHMKTCALKNNVTTKQLLDAMHLQERQAAERRQLGLLEAPVLRDKQKAVPRKSTYEDSEFHLALALSKSLHEIEQKRDWEDTEMLNQLSDNIESIIKGNKYDNTLDNYAFINYKSNGEQSSDVKKKYVKHGKIIRPSILQTRSHEERDRLLAERIAEVIMGNDAITQKICSSEECSDKITNKIVLQSHKLQEFHQVEHSLWQKARLTPKQTLFYVKSLSSHIAPTIKQLEEEDSKLIFTENDTKRDIKESDTQCRSDEQLQSQILPERTTTMNQDIEHDKHRVFTDSLVKDWRNMLNIKLGSDVIIFVSNEKQIWAHKLVFYVRCIRIINDLMPNDNAMIGEKLCWPKISEYGALGFLEFLYCGTIVKYINIFSNPSALSDVKILAKKYNLHALLSYLQDQVMHTDIGYNRNETTENSYKGGYRETSTDDRMHTIANIAFTWNNVDDNTMYHSNIDQPTNTVNDNDYEADIAELKNVGLCSTNTVKNINKSIARNDNASPDMFDDSDSNGIDLTQCDSEAADYANKSEGFTKLSNSTEEVSGGHQHQLWSNPRKSVKIIKSLNDSQEKIQKNHQTENILALNTTPNTKVKNCSVILSDVRKQKSNLTLFIEQVQRENEESDYDLQSELNISLESGKKYIKNPFNIKQSDESIIARTSNQFTKIKTKSSGLSKLEHDILLNAAENPISYNITPWKCAQDGLPNSNAVHKESPMCNVNMNDLDSSSTVTSDEEDKLSMTSSYSSATSGIDINEKDISMYSKYKKIHKRNSIAEYRFDLQKLTSDDFGQHNLCNNKILHKNSNSCDTDLQNKTSSLINDIHNVIVLSNSEDDLSRTSTISLSENISNKVLKELQSISKTMKEHNNKTSITSQNNLSCLSPLQNVCTTHKSEQSENINNIAQNNIYDAETDTENEVRYQGPNKSNEDSTGEINSSKHSVGYKHSSASDNENFFETFDFEPVFDACVASTTDLRTPTKCLNNLTSIKSPIFITSSPELDPNCKDINDHNDDINKDNSNDTELSYLTNARSQITELLTPRENNPADEEYLSIRQKTNIRQLKRKSLSDGHFSSRKLNRIQHIDSSNFYDTNIISTTQLKDTNPCVTPPPDYNTMASPDLHKELRKYGLKLQKRHRAVKLLTYIYNELHPVVSLSPENVNASTKHMRSSTKFSSEIQINHGSLHEQSPNCQYEDDDTQHSQNTAVTSQSRETVRVPEIRYDEDEPAIASNNLINLKEAFLNFLNSNRDLYNKILTYEPLNIQSLHALLKNSGVKCTVNTLMDYLDEQCITFHVPEQNVKRLKKNNLHTSK